jgi:hypothetical protein
VHFEDVVVYGRELQGSVASNQNQAYRLPGHVHHGSIVSYVIDLFLFFGSKPIMADYLDKTAMTNFVFQVLPPILNL